MGGARVEVAKGQPNYIYGCVQAPKSPMNTPITIEALWRIVRQDDAEIEVTIRSRFPARFRPKKIDPDWMIEIDQAPGNFIDRIFFGHRLYYYLSTRGFVRVTLRRLPRRLPPLPQVPEAPVPESSARGPFPKMPASSGVPAPGNRWPLPIDLERRRRREPRGPGRSGCGFCLHHIIGCRGG